MQSEIEGLPLFFLSIAMINMCTGNVWKEIHRTNEITIFVHEPQKPYMESMVF